MLGRIPLVILDNNRGREEAAEGWSMLSRRSLPNGRLIRHDHVDMKVCIEGKLKVLEVYE